MKILIFILFLLSVVSITAETITATIFADNYFEFYVNGEFIKSDPIDFTPHQAVQFTFDVTSGQSRQYAIIANDYATTSGYEYINTTSPKLGDGSLRIIMSDGTVSTSAWKCFTTSYGPTQESVDAGCSANNLDACKLAYYDEPEDWKLISFDDSDWNYATEFTAQEAGWGRTPQYDPTTGMCSTLTDPYTGMNKNPSAIPLPANECIDPQKVAWGKASFIWQGDLDLDNTILCRYTYK